MTPMFTSERMTSTTERSKSPASSRTWTWRGTTTGAWPSGARTAVAAAGCGGAGAAGGVDHASGRRRGRGPRCGGIRLGRAFGISLLAYVVRWVSALASSTRSRSRVASSIAASRARATVPSASPRSRHAGSGQRYAPRPDDFPRRSTDRSPVPAARTIRMRSRFTRSVRHATQVRCGTRRTGLAPIAPLLPAQESAVLFLQLGLVRHRRLRLRLDHQILADRVVVRRGRLRDRLDLDRLRLDRGLGLHLGRDLGLAADVDAPARDLGRKPRVLAFLADGEREVPVGNDDVRRLLLRHAVDAHN